MREVENQEERIWKLERLGLVGEKWLIGLEFEETRNKLKKKI